MKLDEDKYLTLDKAARKEKMTQLIIFVIVVILMSLIYFNLPEDTITLTATTESVGVAQTNAGTKDFWAVKLDTGGLVRVYLSNARKFKKGQLISVVETSSEIGTKIYSLSKILYKENQ